ncbi:MAG: hypothetical protein IJV07_04055 [Alphaproteobacteria bacterium]|nr:hypothetical protein [Alphaproteobacteria bacterium]
MPVVDKLFRSAFCCLFCLTGISGAFAADKLSDARLDLSAGFMQKPLYVKQFYRESWNRDNDVELSTVDQLEYLQKNNPGFDQDTLDIMRRGTYLFKKMDSGMKNTDILSISSEIMSDSPQAAGRLSGKLKTDATLKDALSAVDIIEPTENLAEKMYQGQAPGRKGYQIDIDQFK